MELCTWHIFDRLLEYGTYRTPRAVSDWIPLSMEGIRTNNVRGIDISVGFPQKFQSTLKTLPLCFSTKYTIKLEKKLKDTECSESRSDRLFSWE